MLQIVTYPNPILHYKSEPVKKINDNIFQIINNMIEVMHAHVDGVGFAASQIGILKKIIVVEIDGDSKIFINPEIIQKSEEVEILEESCLSVPGILVDLKRSESIIFKWINMKGEIKSGHAKGLWARVIQHEIDHLYGKLIIDYKS